MQRTVATLLIILGTNVLTYATTRYAVTRVVLTRAEHRMESALRDLDVYEELSSAGDIQFRLAIPLAGGRYYWWNDALPWWSAGIVLLGLGLGALLPTAKPTQPSQS